MKRITTSILLVAIFSSVSAQSTQFEKTFLHGKYQDARGIVQAADGNFLVTGLEKGPIDSLGSLYVTKLNQEGNILWQKYYDYPKEDGGNQIMLSHDGNIIVTGHTESTVGECDGYLLKLKNNGEVIWQKQIGGKEDDVFAASVEDIDGTIYSVGRTENYGATDMDILLHVTKGDGIPINGFHFGTTDYDYATSVVFSEDGNLIISAIAVGSPSSETDAIVLKCDKKGNLIWQKRFSNSGTDGAQKVFVTSQGEIMVIGKKQVAGLGQRAWIFKLNKSGNLIWEKTFGTTGKEEFFTGYKLTDEKFICIGAKPTMNDTFGDFWVTVIDGKGNMSEEYSVGTKLFDIATSTCLNDDQTLCIAGKERVNEADYKSFIVKTDLGGNLHNYIPEGEFDNSVYPNPVSVFTTISLPGNYAAKHLFVYNTAGILVLENTFSENKFILNSQNIPKGLLFYRVTDLNSKSILAGKLISE